MAVKWSYPRIKFTEIDNTIQQNAEPGIGIGAIVLKSNKGPVNMRVLSKTYNEFIEHFGEPESNTDYGHFAAENYLAISNQLLAVRATMGDEEYAQIQFTYPEASLTATNVSQDTCVFKFVDSLGDNNLKLTQDLNNVIDVKTLIDETKGNPEWMADEGNTLSSYCLKQEADYGVFADIMSEGSDVVVYKKGEVVTNEGIHVTYPAYVDVSGNVLTTESKLMFNQKGWDVGSAVSGEILISPKKMFDLGGKYKENTGVKVTLTVPAKYSLNSTPTKLQFIGEYSAVSGWDGTGKGGVEGIEYKDIFKSENFYPAGMFTQFDEDIEQRDPDQIGLIDGHGLQKAYKMQVLDWEDSSVKKTYYVDVDEFEPTSASCSAMKFREYGLATDTYVLVGKKDLDNIEGKDLFLFSACSAMYDDVTPNEDESYLEGRTGKKVIYDMTDAYGLNDPQELFNSYYLRYYDVLLNKIVEKIIQNNIKEKNDDGTLKNINKDLFWLYSEKGDNKTIIKPVFFADTPNFANLPISEDYEVKVPIEDDGEGNILYNTVKRNAVVATPTSYIFNSVDKTYEDGFTLLTQTESEPGNGDLENYNSNFDNQLVIGCMGPGKYGNDIGVSIITAECSTIPALNHPNAFNWKYLYDDEDIVDSDTEDYSENTLDLTWKKVFRINVYAKTKTQTAKTAWGSGMDALLKDPNESFLVSTDPYAKDAEGNSLYAPTVINGHSDYIYVSRTSVSKAKNAKGQYEQPYQTYSIYPLTGGKNSQKDLMTEKTAALKLYNDRQKADFDILFNVDAIETFNGKQRYAAHQRKIAEIAGNRTMDIGVVQLTSKSAKTAKAMLNEIKMFSFQNGTYVAPYANYDKYYNGTLASWIYLPKSVAAACSMAYCDMFSFPWMAPAGVQRGGIAYTTGQLKQLTDEEIGQLYDQNCNTSRACGGFGEVLWGQKTALKKVSALNRINVRRCLNYIEKQLENALTPYMFQQNTPNTRAAAKNVIDSFLQRVKAGEGILSFSTSVTKDPEDSHIMVVNIHVVPAEAIEYIDVKINVDREGITVEEG